MIDNQIYKRKQEQRSSTLRKKLAKENISATNARPRKGPKKGKKKGKDLLKVKYYRCHKKGHYKNKYPILEYQTAAIGDTIDSDNKQTNIYSRKSEDAESYKHDYLLQTACYNDHCLTHLLEKQGSGWFPQGRQDQVAMANSEAQESLDPKEVYLNDESKDNPIVFSSLFKNLSLGNLQDLY